MINLMRLFNQLDQINIDNLEMVFLFLFVYVRMFVVIDYYINRLYARVVDYYDIRTRLILNSNFSSKNLKRLVKKSFLCYHEYVKETCIK